MIDQTKLDRIELKFQEIEKNLDRIKLVLDQRLIEKEKEKQKPKRETKLNLGLILHLTGLILFLFLANYIQGKEQATIYTRAVIAALFFISQIMINLLCDLNDFYKKGI